MTQNRAVIFCTSQAFPFLWGAISVTFQAYALYASMDYKHNTLTPDQEEAQNRFAGNAAAGIGTIFGIVESGLRKTSWLGETPSLGRIIGFGAIEWSGKFLGAAGGAVAAYYDLSHAIDEWQKGTEHRGLTIVYGFQTAADITLMVACLITIPVWSIIAAVIVLFVTSISILFISQTKIQEWLESCLWRRVPGDVPKGRWPAIWPTMETEMNELKLALEEGV